MKRSKDAGEGGKPSARGSQPTARKPAPVRSAASSGARGNRTARKEASESPQKAPSSQPKAAALRHKTAMPAATEKLQKMLARAGFGSRRELEQWIAEGRITINGKVAGIGDRAGPHDRICLDGRRLSVMRLQGPPVRVLLYNKPVGEICTRSDPEGRPTIFDRLPALEKGRWIAVGRLDLNTSGLLILTSDGELANKLMHPSAQIDREYLVRVMGQVDEDMLKRLREGVQLDDGFARFTDVAPMHGGDGDSINRWYCCTLMEGRNREVRRLWESQGLRVSRLKRVRFGPVMLANKLPEGRWQELTRKELIVLYQEAGLKVPELREPTQDDREIARRQRRKSLRPVEPHGGRRR